MNLVKFLEAGDDLPWEYGTVLKVGGFFLSRITAGFFFSPRLPCFAPPFLISPSACALDCIVNARRYRLATLPSPRKWPRPVWNDPPNPISPPT